MTSPPPLYFKVWIRHCIHEGRSSFQVHKQSKSNNKSQSAIVITNTVFKSDRIRALGNCFNCLLKCDLHFKAGDDHLFKKPRWIFQGCNCWQTHVKLVVFFNNFPLIMTIFGSTSYLRKHRGNRFVLWHFRVFPDPLWCTSATEQNWQNSGKNRGFFNKKYAKKIAVGLDETL